MGQNVDDDLRLVLASRYEQGADGPVDKARYERFALAWASLAFEVASGYFTRRIRLFLIIHSERKKILGGIRRACGHNRGKYRRLAILRQDCAVGLPRDAP